MRHLTRLTKGTTGTVFHRLYNKAERRAYVWAMNLKPGDVINSFDTMNHEVKFIEIEWSPVHVVRCHSVGFGITPRGMWVSDVVIHSTNGWQHCISETGVIEPGFSMEKLRDICGREAIDAMLSMGIIDARGVRLRSATDDEKWELKRDHP